MPVAAGEASGSCCLCSHAHAAEDFVFFEMHGLLLRVSRIYVVFFFFFFPSETDFEERLQYLITMGNSLIQQEEQGSA